MVGQSTSLGKSPSNYKPFNCIRIRLSTILTGQEFGVQLSLLDGNWAKQFGSTSTMRKEQAEIPKLDNNQAEHFQP